MHYYILKFSPNENLFHAFINSVVLAWLGLKALALASPEAALAFVYKMHKKS